MTEEQLRIAVEKWLKTNGPIGILPAYLKKEYPNITQEDLSCAQTINVQISDTTYRRTKN